MTYASSWRPAAALAALALVLFASVLVPVMLIQPFAPQTEAAIAASYLLRRWSPWATLAGLGLLLWGTVRTWPRVRSRWGRGLLLLPAALGAFAAWGARQNHFEWMFAPLPGAGFARAVDASFVAAEDMVLAVARGADAVAYPVRQLAYHHLVEDEIGGVPIVATY